ncbi:MAG: hypothetical protein EP344_05065 [Bacteroidetes bacterium]|nr:MAG: hypothetical protein EP344_05065 [Bacteroidota bacterium]
MLERIAQLLKQAPDHIYGRIVDNHIILDIVGEKAHYWSPQLNFRVEADEDDQNQAVIAGLIGPKPGVWTLFVFVYFSIGIIGFVISSYGVSNYILGRYSYTLLAFPIAILLMLTAYKAGKYGEQLGADQIEMLKDFVREAISMAKTGHADTGTPSS